MRLGDTAGKAQVTAADVILASLPPHGIEFFFANPGTDFPPSSKGLRAPS